MMNAETATGGFERHRLNAMGRSSLEIYGVTDVLSFDEQSVVLNTTCGEMEILGGSLHISVLNLEQGIVTMSGRVDSVSYLETEPNEKDAKQGFFSKLFR